MEDQIQEAIKVLHEGGIVIYPTDTAFAVGCRIDREVAVERLFQIRKRPKTQATPVLVDTVKMAQDYLLPIPKEVIDRLVEPYWPGALTIILYCNKVKVTALVRGGGETLGVRIPNHATARAIIRGVGMPILGPSANLHGAKTPYKMGDLDKEFIKQVDFVVSGECKIGNVSTVIDCSVKPWKVLRYGAIKLAVSNMNILLIDTSSNKEIKVGLTIKRKTHWLKKAISYQKAQVVLPMIDQIITANKIRMQDIEAIEVVAGPGSFTGLRVGIAVANALCSLLDIPVNGKRQIVHPSYQDFN